MGMTREEFWEQDSTLVIAYRKAWEIRQEQENRMAWLQGLYIHHALASVPIVVQGFAKKSSKLPSYPEKPFEFNPPKAKLKPVDAEAKKKSDRFREQMMAWSLEFNKQRRMDEMKKLDEEKGVISDGRGDADTGN